MNAKNNGAKKVVGTAIAAGAAGALIVGASPALDLPPWVVDAFRQWGPAGALLGLLVWYVPRSSIQDFIQAQKEQAIAMQKVGDQLQVMTGQAGKLDEIAGDLKDMKLNADIFGDRLRRIEEHLINDKRQDDL